MNEINNVSELINLAMKEVQESGIMAKSKNKFVKCFNTIKLWYSLAGVSDYSLEHSFNCFSIYFNFTFTEDCKLNRMEKEFYRCIRILDDLQHNRKISIAYQYRDINYLELRNDHLIIEYEDYCVKAGNTIKVSKKKQRMAMCFINYLQDNDINIKDIDRNIINDFMYDEFSRLNKVCLNKYLSSLKSFLYYLYESNLTKVDLSVVVPSVKVAKENTIPSVWKLEEVKQLLESIDRSTISGKRDYAIILLIITTAMRGIDAINLHFSNVDFDNDIISFVQSKTKVEVTVPLVESTKDALLDYIDNGRPKSDSEYIFLTIKTPYRNLMSANAISSMLTNRVNESDIEFSRNQKRGVHSLRHTAISTLFNNTEISTITIAEISGHSNINSLNHYIKVDEERLKECTLSLDFIEKDDDKNEE